MKRVKATQRGFDGTQIIEPGTEFTVPDDAKQASWWVVVEEGPPEKPEKQVSSSGSKRN
jgi:hypothetical protein